LLQPSHSEVKAVIEGSKFSYFCFSFFKDTPPMKHLLLIRHAKSGYRHDELVDFGRTLNSQGREEAQQLAEQLATLGFIPDKVLCSPAARTVQTLHFLVRSGFVLLEDVIFLPELYLATSNIIYEACKQSGADHVAVIGHNPGLSDLAVQLVKEPSLILPLGTAGWHLLKHQKHWERIDGDKQLPTSHT
jgi:phosphohistidine phosphatase